MRGVLALWLVLFACLTWGSVARAERGTVVLETASDPEGSAVRDRTEDELRVAGFVVVSAANGSDLERLAAERSALAIVTLTRGGADGQWVISVVDRVTGKTTERHVAAAVDGGADAPRIALLAVELLYASLLELETSAPVERPVAVPPSVTREVRRRLVAPPVVPRWALRAGGGFVGSPGFGAPPGVTAGGSAWTKVGLGADVAGFFAVLPVRVGSGDVASARVSLGQVRGSAVVVLQPERLLSLSMGLGGGLLVATSQGKATAPLVGVRDHTAVALLSATAAGTWKIRRHLRLRLDSAASLAVPELDIRFADASVASAGRPLLEATLGGEWTWP